MRHYTTAVIIKADLVEFIGIDISKTDGLFRCLSSLLIFLQKGNTEGAGDKL